MASEGGERDINDVLLVVGIPGRYQLNTFFWAFIIGIVTAFHTYAIPFIQSEVNFR